MALSYYSNCWGALQQITDSDVDQEPPLMELPPELRAFPDPWNIDYSLFDPNDLFYSENYPTSLLPDFSYGVPSSDHYNVNSFMTEPVSLKQEFEPFHYPKRQKRCIDHDEIHQFKPDFFDGLVPNPCLMLQYYLPPEIALPPLHDFPTGPPVFSSGISSPCESLKKEPPPPPPPTAATALSAQSIAARQRRRKITEKTQELGKLVPGGQKMNTAEMLQSAYKYIKFLQAQVGVLEFIGSSQNQENKDSLSEGHEDELMRILLESPLIQEKLYSSEKCLIPQKFVQELGPANTQIQPSVAFDSGTEVIDVKGQF